MITTIQHPTSGETYAVELDERDTIIRAAGPLAARDARDEQSLSDWLDNSLDAAEDGAWLEGERGERPES